MLHATRNFVKSILKKRYQELFSTNRIKRHAYNSKKFPSLFFTTFLMSNKEMRKKSEFNSQKKITWSSFNKRLRVIWVTQKYEQISILYTEKILLFLRDFHTIFPQPQSLSSSIKWIHMRRLESEFFMNVFTKEVLSYTTSGAWQLTWRMFQLFQPKEEI